MRSSVHLSARRPVTLGIPKGNLAGSLVLQPARRRSIARAAFVFLQEPDVGAHGRRQRDVILAALLDVIGLHQLPDAVRGDLQQSGGLRRCQDRVRKSRLPCRLGGLLRLRLSCLAMPSSPNQNAVWNRPKTLKSRGQCRPHGPDARKDPVVAEGTPTSRGRGLGPAADRLSPIARWRGRLKLANVPPTFCP